MPRPSRQGEQNWVSPEVTVRSFGRHRTDTALTIAWSVTGRRAWLGAIDGTGFVPHPVPPGKVAGVSGEVMRCRISQDPEYARKAAFREVAKRGGFAGQQGFPFIDRDAL